MGTVTKNADRLYTGRFSACYSQVRYTTWKEASSVTRSATSKRTKPQGVELLFAPTVLNHSWYEYCDAPWTSQPLSMVSCGVDKPPAWPILSLTNFRGTSPNTGGMGRAWSTYYPSPSNLALLGKIKHQGTNLAVCLGEYRQTAKMFSDVGDALWTLYRGVRRGQFLHLLHSGVKSAPSTWLMYRYGVSPLISDMKAIMEILTDARVKPLVQKFVVKHSTIRDYQNTKPFISDIGTNYVGSETITGICTRRDVAWVQWTSSSLQNIVNTGLTNPVQIAWELIPYSFVVDWFFSIGDYLAALDALTGVSRARAQRIYKGTSTYAGLARGARMSAGAYQRSDLSLTPDPPRWDPSPTWKRIVDSLALARQRFSR